MRPNRFCLLALLVWLALCAPAFAQDPNAMPEDYKRERVQELIVMRLNNELGLNPSQSQQIAQILRKYHQERAGLRRQLRDLTGQLRAVSTGGNEAQIQALLRQITSTRNQLDQVDDRMFAEVKPLLTPRQQAQYLLVMDEIRQEVKAIRNPMMGPPGYYGPGYVPGGDSNSGAVRVGPPY